MSSQPFSFRLRLLYSRGKGPPVPIQSVAECAVSRSLRFYRIKISCPYREWKQDPLLSQLTDYLLYRQEILATTVVTYPFVKHEKTFGPALSHTSQAHIHTSCFHNVHTSINLMSTPSIFLRSYDRGS